MPEVFLGLGSNMHAEDNLRLCVGELRKRFRLRGTSSVYSSKAIGFDGDDFLNAVAVVETDLTPIGVHAEIEQIHDVAGRKRTENSFVSRTLDIDLLLFDVQIIDEPPVRVPRDDVLNFAFVLCPLAEVAPGFRHPVSQKTLQWHWENFEKSRHPLRKVDLKL